MALVALCWRTTVGSVTPMKRPNTAPSPQPATVDITVRTPQLSMMSPCMISSAVGIVTCLYRLTGFGDCAGCASAAGGDVDAASLLSIVLQLI